MLNTELNTVDLDSESSDPCVGRVFPVSLDDVRRAHRVVMEHLPPTPLVNHPLLSERVGCEVFVKLENTHNIGSFKIRGGLNLLANMSDGEKARGL
ncbi:MAG: pyridoxal-phosphate dependent enzyme, partial [Gammaproteobacteria bacterium]